MVVHQCAPLCVCPHTCARGFVRFLCIHLLVWVCMLEIAPFAANVNERRHELPSPKHPTKHHPPKTMHSRCHFDTDNCKTQNVASYKGVTYQMGLRELLLLYCFSVFIVLLTQHYTMHTADPCSSRELKVTTWFEQMASVLKVS